MILFFILIFLFFAIITSKFKIEIKNLCLNSQEKHFISNEYQIKILFKIFYNITILKLRINKRKINKMMKNPKIKNKINEEKLKIMKSKIKIRKEDIKTLKKLRIEIKNLKLKLKLGTEDVALTAIVIPVFSTIISMVLKNQMKSKNKNEFEILPLYQNENLIKVHLSGIFEIKMMHIINTMFIFYKNKKRKGDKNERTSNRRSYDYSYGQY